jgi:hypothetical protein
MGKAVVEPRNREAVTSVAPNAIIAIAVRVGAPGN